MSNKPTHVYIGVRDGIVTDMIADKADDRTSEYVSIIIGKGGYVERLPLNEACDRDILFKPWPRESGQ